VANTRRANHGAERGLRRHHSQLRGGLLPMRSHGQNTISTGTKLVGLTLAAALATAGFGCGDSGGNSPGTGGKGGTTAGTAGTTGTAGSTGTAGTGPGGSAGGSTAGT